MWLPFASIICEILERNREQLFFYILGVKITKCPMNGTPNVIQPQMLSACQTVGVLPPSRGHKSRWQIPAPRKSLPLPYPSVFSVSCPSVDSAEWAVVLLLRSGDIESNPGPGLTWTCDICTRTITTRQISLRCNSHNEHWVHRHCSGITTTQYTNTWMCPLHNLAHNANTPPTPPHIYLRHMHTHHYNTPTYPTTLHTNTHHWIHQHCSGITTRQYTNTWVCPQHNPITTHTTHTHSPTTTQPHTPQHPHPHHQPPTPQPPTPQPPTPQQNQHSPGPSNKTLHILQFNINGLHKNVAELTQTARQHNIDIIMIQETKLNTRHKTPHIPNYTPIRTDRAHKQGGGLITYIHNTVTFTNITIPAHINIQKTELQVTKVHFTKDKSLHLANIYIPPRDTTDPNHSTEDTDITNTFTYLTTLNNTIIGGDINAHEDLWYSPTTDHRGTLIADIILNSTHNTLNTNTPTRKPPHADQQPTSPDITTAPHNISRLLTWATLDKHSSDHLPILVTYNTRTTFRLHQPLNTYTNYRKAAWTEFTQEIEHALENTEPSHNPQSQTKYSQT